MRYLATADRSMIAVTGSVPTEAAGSRFEVSTDLLTNQTRLKADTTFKISHFTELTGATNMNHADGIIRHRLTPYNVHSLNTTHGVTVSVPLLVDHFKDVTFYKMRHALFTIACRARGTLT